MNVGGKHIAPTPHAFDYIVSIFGGCSQVSQNGACFVAQHIVCCNVASEGEAWVVSHSEM